MSGHRAKPFRGLYPMSALAFRIPSMAKTINISYMGEEAIFGYKPIDRGALYGKRKRVPFDAEGNECAKASLLDDGSLLIRSGMTAQGYFDAQGNWVPQGELETINPDGSIPQLIPATVGETVEAVLIDPADALFIRFETTYSLDAESLPNGIKEALDSGSIFTFPFNPKADYHMETGILVSNENGYFALIGNPTPYEFSGLGTLVSVSEEASGDTADDLDFEMF